MEAENGDKVALAEAVGKLQMEVPAPSSQFTKRVEDSLVALLTHDKSLWSQHELRCDLHKFRQSLLGEDPTPVEKVLVEQVALNWAALRAAESSLANFKEGPITLYMAREARVEKAHSRFLASIRTLAQVRRLQIPAVLQLNVAEKQVNIVQ